MSGLERRTKTDSAEVFRLLVTQKYTWYIAGPYATLAAAKGRRTALTNQYRSVTATVRLQRATTVWEDIE